MMAAPFVRMYIEKIVYEEKGMRRQGSNLKNLLGPKLIPNELE